MNAKSVPIGRTRTPEDMPFPKKTFKTQVAMNVSVTSPIARSYYTRLLTMKRNPRTDDEDDEDSI